MGNHQYKTLFLRAFSILFLCTLGGAIFHAWILGFALGCLVCFVDLVFQIRRLEKWIAQIHRGDTDSDHSLSGIWTGINYNISRILREHNREKQRLLAVIQRVQSVGTAFSDAAILLDPTGKIDWWNKAAESLFNFRPEDKGQLVTHLIRHPKFTQYFDSGNHDTPLEVNMWRSDQHLEFKLHVFGSNERLLVVRDITRLYKLEEMRKDFIANVSHELRTPLTVIRGYLETLLDNWDIKGNTPQFTERSYKMLQQMETQSQRMNLLVNDLIILTKLETSGKDNFSEPVILAPLMAEIAQDARIFSGAREHKIQVTGNPELALIGNERELRSAVMNLLVNAVNYSPAESQIDLEYQFSSTGAFICVRDHGIGIDEKHIPRLTERFYRVDPGRAVISGGTGLGLAIVKHVLLRHNGELRIKSEPGKGSEFCFDFPVNVVRRINPAQ
jgi:two-component system, OmpR family, phosphate regulon sensor histidine kinase PhoR